MKNKLIALFIILSSIMIVNVRILDSQLDNCNIDVTTSSAKTVNKIAKNDLKYNKGVELDTKGYNQNNNSTNYKTDTYWLSRIISAEAKGESLQGKIAVGNVVLNRVEAKDFPDTVEEVVFQKNQFCPVRNGSVYDEPVEEAVRAAELVLKGERVVDEDIYYFYNPQVVSRGSWIRTREVSKTIGNHNFAK